MLCSVQWYRNRWPWMTLNGHFALKSVSGSATNGLTSPAFGQNKTVRKFAEPLIYCQRQKCSPGNVVSGSIRFMQIFAGVRWRGGVKWEWSLKMAIFASFVHCLPNILHTWPHDMLSCDTTVNDLGHISRSLDCFTSNFSKTVCNTAVVTIDN